MTITRRVRSNGRYVSNSCVPSQQQWQYTYTDTEFAGAYEADPGGGKAIYRYTSDAVPNAFSFTDQTAVALSSTRTSAAITVAGVNISAVITVSGGTYDINASGTFVSTPGTVVNGDTVRARHTASASEVTAVNTVVTIGGVSDTFTSTTADLTPTAFTFTDQTGVALGATITSAAITVAGINAATVISVSGGTYDINASGTFTASAGTVVNGDTVRARHTSSASPVTAVNTVVTIGGVSDTFTSTTIASLTYDVQHPVFSTPDLNRGYQTFSTAYLTNACELYNSGGGTTGRDVGDELAGWCFPAVTLTTCTSATLTLVVSADAGTAGTFKVCGDSNAADSSLVYVNPTRVPVNAVPVAAEATTVSGGGALTTAVGSKVLDVTTMVQQIMAGGHWVSGYPLCFYGEATSAAVNPVFQTTGAHLVVVGT